MRFKRDFNETFFFFLEKLRKRENFAFVRYSDGELDIIQNLYVELSSTLVRRGDDELNLFRHLIPQKIIKFLTPSIIKKAANF